MGYRKDKIIRECNAFQISMSDSLGKIQIKKFFFFSEMQPIGMENTYS